MAEEEDLNITLDALISKERRSRRPRGVGKRPRRERPMRRESARRRGRPTREPRRRSSFGGSRRRSLNERLDETWDNDMYDDKYGGSSRSFSSRPRRREDRDRDRDYDFEKSSREPSSFTTRSGLQVSVGGNMINPDLKTSIQINGLHTNVSQADLWEILNKYGALKYVYIMYKEDGKTPSGSGRACFQQASDARKSVEDLRDATIDGVPIRITFLGEAGADPERGRSFKTSSRYYDDDETGDVKDEMDEEGSRRGRNRTMARRSQQVPTDPANPLMR